MSTQDKAKIAHRILDVLALFVGIDGLLITVVGIASSDSHNLTTGLILLASIGVLCYLGHMLINIRTDAILNEEELKNDGE